MFDEIRERILNIVTSRLTILTMVILFLAGVLIYRCFNLQIVQGEEYLNKFMLETEKTRDIASTRGRILDQNGVVLAYNELAYSVKIEDVYESTRGKNKKLNTTIYKLIKMIEKNGDQVITDFNVVIDENGSFAYNVEGTSLLRFLADVYGHTTIDKLKDEQRNATADEIIQYLGGKNQFALGDYEEEGNSDSKFIVGKGYTRNELLQMVTIRYAMKLTSFRKYIGTTVATDVSDKTVAVIMENSFELDGVSIEEDTVRRYVDSKYFAHILGYTGKISSEELKSLNEQEALNGGNEERYNINDVVGKSGIEAYMEPTLQGIKGNEKVSVDNMGKLISILERTESQAGGDVYLTIRYDLQIAAYKILEQRIAGILADKIINTKEFNLGKGESSDIKIPIYDVYFAIIDNSVLDMNHFAAEDAGETEAVVYGKYLEYRQGVYDKLLDELSSKKTAYNKLSKEYQVYQSNIVSMLAKNEVIVSNLVDVNDATYIAWTKDEVISLNEYLNYIIAQNWIDVTKLQLDDKYSSSEEVFQKLMEYIIQMIDTNQEFQKKLYKYMLLNDVITGKQVCMMLCEQNVIEVPFEDEDALYSGKLSPYQFMMNRILNLEITPAQLALDPCNGSVVITDVNTGAVLAMVSYPGYDNNKMANSVDAQFYAKMMTDKSKPSLNYATQYKAAPGSTFKMVTAAAGLGEGVITPSTNIICTGTFTSIDPSPRCWKRSGHGSQNLASAIQNSCNYFFYEVGYRLSTRSGSYVAKEGLDALAKYADMFGLTEKSGVQVAELEPNISDEYPVPSAIGQGTYSTTTASLAKYVATVANGGTCYDLTLLKKVTDSQGNLVEEFTPEIRNTVDMPPEYWNMVHSGMRKVVEGKRYFNDLAVTVAGKTGTAQQIVSRPNHALFVGYAPYEKPELSIATRVPFGYSSDYAAQTTRDIIMYYYGLAQEEELITGTADAPDAGATNEW